MASSTNAHREPDHPRSLDALLSGLVDYAGLFPPAALPMSEVVRNYASYVEGARAQFLGRLIVPVARLDELELEAAGLLAPGRPWRLSALGGQHPDADLDAILAFNARHAEADDAVVDTLEAKAASAAEAGALAAAARTLTVFVEVALDETLESMLDEVAVRGLRAKARTGGVTPDAIPPVEAVARFLLACAERRLPFKATAGLHHPLRSEHPLTYAADAPRGLMHGFLNVFLAAAFAWDGEPADVVLEVLEERRPAAFEFGPEGVTWQGRELAEDDLLDVRQNFALSFGSCSFAEPVEDLEALHLI